MSYCSHPHIECFSLLYSISPQFTRCSGNRATGFFLEKSIRGVWSKHINQPIGKSLIILFVRINGSWNEKFYTYSKNLRFLKQELLLPQKWFLVPRKCFLYMVTKHVFSSRKIVFLVKRHVFLTARKQFLCQEKNRAVRKKKALSVYQENIFLAS